MGKQPADVKSLWDRFVTRGDPAAREALIVHYAPLVRRVVGGLTLSWEGTLDYQDLLSSGLPGLMEAVDRFDPQRGVAFASFASPRIRGSVLDALRSWDPVSRLVRKRSKLIALTKDRLWAQTGRTPSDEETAVSVGMDLRTCREVMRQERIATLSLERVLGRAEEDGSGMALSEMLRDPATEDITLEIEERDLRAQLRQALLELPARELLVLSLYYFEGLTVREIAERLQRSPSRASQLLARGIAMLRERMVYVDRSSGVWPTCRRTAAGAAPAWPQPEDAGRGPARVAQVGA